MVATAGTTSLGALDDVAAVADLCAAHGARLHVDAAYGGFFALLADGGSRRRPRAVPAIARADSVVVDPHKHGLQPYGCGCVLFADPGVAGFFLHDSPVHVLQHQRSPPGRDDARVLAAGRGRGRAVGDASRAAADAGGARLPPRGAPGRRASRSPTARCGDDASSSWSSPSSTSSASSPPLRRRRRSARRRAGVRDARRVGLARREAPPRDRVAAAVAPVDRGRRADGDGVRLCLIKPEHLAWSTSSRTGSSPLPVRRLQRDQDRLLRLEQEVVGQRRRRPGGRARGRTGVRSLRSRTTPRSVERWFPRHTFGPSLNGK